MPSEPRYAVPFAILVGDLAAVAVEVALTRALAGGIPLGDDAVDAVRGEEAVAAVVECGANDAALDSCEALWLECGSAMMPTGGLSARNGSAAIESGLAAAALKSGCAANERGVLGVEAGRQVGAVGLICPMCLFADPMRFRLPARRLELRHDELPARVRLVRHKIRPDSRR